MMKTAVFLGILAMIGTVTARADDIRRIGLDGKEGATAPAAQPGKDGIDRIHKVEQPQLMIFPAAKKPSHGTIMVCPGGGYGILAVNHEGTDVAKMLNDDGWDAAVLLYRVSEGDKTRAMALDDAKAGLTLIQKRGSEFGTRNKKDRRDGFLRRRSSRRTRHPRIRRCRITTGFRRADVSGISGKGRQAA